MVVVVVFLTRFVVVTITSLSVLFYSVNIENCFFFYFVCQRHTHTVQQHQHTYLLVICIYVHTRTHTYISALCQLLSHNLLLTRKTLRSISHNSLVCIIIEMDRSQRYASTNNNNNSKQEKKKLSAVKNKMK